MKALANAQVIFSVLPRAKDQIALWADDRLDDRAGIGRERARVRTGIEVLAHSGNSAEFVQPLNLIFDEVRSLSKRNGGDDCTLAGPRNRLDDPALICRTGPRHGRYIDELGEHNPRLRAALDRRDFRQ